MRYNPFSKVTYLQIDIRRDEPAMRRVISLVLFSALASLGGSLVSLIYVITYTAKAYVLAVHYQATWQATTIPLLSAACALVLFCLADALYTQFRILIAARNLARISEALSPFPPGPTNP